MFELLFPFFIKTQVSVYLLEYKDSAGVTSTTQTYTDYNSCNTKATNLSQQGYQIIQWCVQT